MKSSNVIPIQQHNRAVVHIAKVLSVADSKYCQIELSGSIYKAQVVFSCLVKPVIEDVVMCVLSESGDYYITSIIERLADQSITLSSPSDMTIQSLSGSINLCTTESVTIAASESINCISENTLHKSKNAVINFDDLTASGSAIQVSYSIIRVFSDMINIISKQVLQKFKNYIRQSEEMDQVKAGNMTRKVDGLYSMSSENAIILSEKDIKIDAEHIHMG